MEIKIHTKIEREVLEDIFVTALEGGSNYWYCLSMDAAKLIRAVVPKKEDPYLSTAILKAIERGVEIPINDAEDESYVVGAISMKTMKERIQKLADSPNKWALVKHINGEGDGDSADVVFQYLAMGEIIYS